MSSSTNRTLLAPQYVDELRMRGHEVHEIQHGLLDATQKNIGLRFINNKLLKKRNVRLLSEELVQQISAVKPEICLVFKGMHYSPECLASIKREGTKLVNLNPDHPTKYGPNQGNQNVKESISLFDLYITFSEIIKNELENSCTDSNCAVIPFGYGLTRQQFNSLANVPEINRACFVGMADKHRARKLNTLATENTPIDVYGKGWFKYKLQLGKYVRTFPEITGMDYWRVLKAYRVQLNLLRYQNTGMHNMRSFEIPGAGGIMLCPYTDEHANYFNDGSQIFLYSSTAEAKCKLGMLLRMEKQRVNEVRRSARQHSEESKYHYSYRAEELEKLLDKVVQGVV